MLSRGRPVPEYFEVHLGFHVLIFNPHECPSMASQRLPVRFENQVLKFDVWGRLLRDLLK